MNQSRQSGHRADMLIIMSCMPVVIVVGAVLIIAGGFNPGFAVPAIVVGLMVGMLTYVTMRDRDKNYPGAAGV